MKKRFWIWMFIIVLLLSACALKWAGTGEKVEAVTLNDTDAERILLHAAELRPEGGVWLLDGNKVYFGQYNGVPTIYRVLASPDTQAVTDSLLLDCGTTLELKKFDDNFKRNETQEKQANDWKGSDIELWLNGEEFYGSETVFSRIERAAIADTVLSESGEAYTIGNWSYEDCGAEDHVFLLSAAEAERLYRENAARAKEGCSTSWWLRSAFGRGNGAGSIHGDGHICNNSISIFGVGVSPALNLELSSILFASAVGETIWKLTLQDPGMTVKVTDRKAVTREVREEGVVITIPYTYTGENVNRISVMLTDKAYSESDAQVLYYGALREVSSENKAGTGAFFLPAALEDMICGEAYHAYILAGDVGGEQETDYASEFCAITIPPASAAEG